MISGVPRAPVNHGMVRMVLGFVIHTRHIISFEQQCGRHAELSVKVVLDDNLSHGHVMTIGVDVERTSDNLDILTEHP